MGSFEKLGILVIVVIIVMILAVAIYQWGGTGIPGMGPGAGNPAFKGGVLPLVMTPPFRPEDPEEVFYLKRERERRDAESKKLADDSSSSTDLKSTKSAQEWDGGIPRVYKVRKGDILWNVVVKRWKLKESFCAAIARANPKVRMTRLGAGRRLEIPNPQAFFSGGRVRSGEGAVRPGTRWYEIQIGDRLETISRAHLGKKSRWREILAINPGLDPKKIRPGQRIRLPAR